jgi:ligand-binding SRPBCC domain-containing protein
VRVHVLEREQVLPQSLPEVFEFFAQAGNLELITPPWLDFELLTSQPIAMHLGTQIEYRLHVHRVPIRWLSRIEVWDEQRCFVDRQLRGPYRLWHHRHDFANVAGGTRVRDRVDYALPLGPLGELAHALLVRRDLDRIFDFRRETVARLMV